MENIGHIPKRESKFEGLAHLPDLDEKRDPAGHQYEQTRVLLAQIGEYDELRENTPCERFPRDAHCGLAVAPKAYVVFKGQKLEQQVEKRHEKGQEEQIEVGVREYGVQLVELRVIEAHGLHALDGCVDLGAQAYFANGNGLVRNAELERAL